MPGVRVLLAQFNPTVGDISLNARKIVQMANAAKKHHQADLVVFPELALCGYPPEDLLFHSAFHAAIRKGLHAIQRASRELELDVLVGYPERTADACFNAAIWFRAGEQAANYRKRILPNQGVFDEKRYFRAGTVPCVVDLAGCHVGILICEDLWVDGPVLDTKNAGANVLLCINASPYFRKKSQYRAGCFEKQIGVTQLPLLYINTVGGQDGLVFDGDTQALDASGHRIARAPDFQEALLPIELSGIPPHPQCETPGPLPLHYPKSVYQALQLGLGDYVRKNHFSDVLVGLSGGIDSALTLTLAADTLGSEHVHACFMPSVYTSKLSREIVRSLCQSLNVQLFGPLSIQPLFKACLKTMKPFLKGQHPGVVEENIQARIRMTLLMALCNRYNFLLLATGNKSELAVGYATLYGDMGGGFCVLKDVLKTEVYELAAFRNRRSEVIPPACLERAPTAELAPHQTDQDVLPPYDVLDAVLKRLIEENLSIEQIAREGFDPALVSDIVRRVRASEYKRRQGSPGPRVSDRAFGKDWRYPITSGFLG